MCINGASGKQQLKTWKPGELKTIVQEQHAKKKDQLQTKVFNQGRLHQHTHG